MKKNELQQIIREELAKVNSKRPVNEANDLKDNLLSTRDMTKLIKGIDDNISFLTELKTKLNKIPVK